MRKLIPLLLGLAIQASLFCQTGSISGKVTDKHTIEALGGATVTISGSLASVITNNEGIFNLQNIKVGKTVLIISHVGYETTELPVTVTAGNKTTADVMLVAGNRVESNIVVSASKRPEKITNAPASIQVIGLKDFDEFAGSNIGELVSKVQGIEFTRTGVDGTTFNARGFNSAFNYKVLQLVDGRNSMAALSGGLPVLNNGSYLKEDIERLEIVLGPQSALYGPNALNAVFNTITKDPRKYQGTTVAVSGGNQYQFSGRLRQAAKINDKWAYKFNGEYATGKEFVFNDSVYVPSPTSPTSVPERNVDFDFRHIRGEGHIYYSLTNKTDIVVSGGGATNNFVQVTTGGRNQMRGVTYNFLQARLVNPNFFVNIYNTWGNIGTSYPITPYTRDFYNLTHPPNPLISPDSAERRAIQKNQFKEESQRLNAEAQYNYTFQKAGLFLVTGLNYQKERPNGFGVNLVDKFEHIYVTQYGGVLQLEKTLPWNSRFIGSVRVDHHSNFGDFCSPKLALTKSVGNGNIRVSWGKAYAMPSILIQYSNLNNSLFGNGAGVTYIPNGATDESSSYKTTQSLKPEQVTTLELGYKGTIARKLFVDINYYNGLSKNFLGPAQSVGGRAKFLGDIALIHNPATAGVFENGILKNASFLTYFNYGDVRAYGLDAGLTYYFSNIISLAIKYSWFDSDITKDDPKNDANKDDYVSADEKSLNAPNNRGLAILSFQNLGHQKMFVNISARYIEQYDFYSGSQIGTAGGEGKRGIVYRAPGLPPLIKNFDWGPLGGFTTMDLSAGCKLNKNVQVAIGITNLLNTDQIEFVGSPSIGRLIMAELKVHVPNRITR